MRKKISESLICFLNLTLFFLTNLILPGCSKNLTFEKTRHFPSGTLQVQIAKIHTVRRELLANIAPIVQQSIAEGYYPGAVILIGHNGHIIYRGVFGNRRLVPNVAPMRLDTIFDLASLTKVVATTPAIMQLLEQGKLELDSPVAQYWPAFAANGKEKITIRELLTHTSGLPSDLSAKEIDRLTATMSVQKTYPPQCKQEVLNDIVKTKLLHPPGTQFVYSDLNFIVLGYLVEIISGMPFEQYVSKNIFLPLGMKDTQFLPLATLHDRIAPTEVINRKLRWGVVHDPIAFLMGGISGMAGLFSTANDLGIYAETLINNGKIPTHNKNYSESKYLLGPMTILKMTTPQTPLNMLETYGLGWDIDSIHSSRGVLFSTNSFGHTGYTGTSLWIDPSTKTWLIILTNRVHPSPRIFNKLISDRKIIANIVAASIIGIDTKNLDNTSLDELKQAYGH